MKTKDLNPGYFGTERGTAFSLIDLMLVMATLAILATLLLPSLSGGLGGAQNAGCINNLAQLGVAARLYADDNNYRLPTAEALPSYPRLPYRPVLRISDVLGPYAARTAQGGKGPPLFKCPADRQWFYEVEGSSYRWNTNLDNMPIDLGETFRMQGAGATQRRGVSGTIHSPPVQTPMLLDYAPFHPRKKVSGQNAVYVDDHVAPLGSP